MVETFYNPKKVDLGTFGEVVPDLACSLEEALNTGVIRNGGDNVGYENDLTSPSEVGDYIRDNIDALVAAKRIGESLANSKNNTPRDAALEV